MKQRIKHLVKHLPRAISVSFFLAILAGIFTTYVFGETTILQIEGKGILVKTVPPNAKVYIDGALRGYTPLKIGNILPGPHILTIKKTFFEDFRLEIIVPQDGCISISCDLTEKPQIEDAILEDNIN
ncbi:MAG: PEGA domain-containing protein [Spirochaetaceae bacterium]|nr:PEGA domain-containing protein [Spirochaetaceae bacterium]